MLDQFVLMPLVIVKLMVSTVPTVPVKPEPVNGVPVRVCEPVFAFQGV